MIYYIIVMFMKLTNLVSYENWYFYRKSPRFSSSYKQRW